MAFGVPQGSVLGPILFLIFINDMPLSSRLFRYTLFADDTCLFMSHEDPKTLEDLVNSELENIDQWLIDNRLSLNVDKSCFLLFTGKTRFQQDFKICISDKEVSRVSAAKYLGVHIDDKLNWQLHLSHVLTKIKQGLGALRKIKHVISPFDLTSLYYAFIQSHLQYCVTSWGSPNTNGITQLNHVINKSISLISKIHDKHNLLIFTPLNISDIYKLESCKLIHRFNNKVIPKPLNKLFKKPPHDHITRQIECNSVDTLVFDQSLSAVRFYGPLK